MAYAGELPWHGLGTKVSNDLTPREMLVAAGLDWTVSKRPVRYDATVQVDPQDASKGKERKSFSVDNIRVLIRDTDGQYLDTVGANWKPLQNEEAFDFFREFVDAGNMEMHTAGALRDGRFVWALARIKNEIVLPGNDTLLPYLLFTNPHKFGNSIDVRFTAIRVVCNNTLTAALGSGSTEHRVRVSHRRDFDKAQVQETLGLANDQFIRFAEAAQMLQQRKYTDETVVDFVRRVFPVTTAKADSKKELSLPAKRVLEVLETQPGAELAPGSWWNAFNAVTFHTDHRQGRSADNRLYSAWYGPNQTRKVEALKIALEMAA